MYITPDQRASILLYVSEVLPPEALGDASRVAEAAGPLAEWAEQAHGWTDGQVRIRVMYRAQINLKDAARHADSDGPPVELSPARLLSETLAYYTFITGAPVPAGPCS